MPELLTATQMRNIEAAAIATGQVTGLELMERAGVGVMDAVHAKWPELSMGARDAVVLCGPGNNGGDGFVVARLLANAGWAVQVFLYGDAVNLPPDARTNFERWCKIGSVAALTASTFEEHGFPGPCALLVDAMFGTGLGRAVALPLDKLTFDERAETTRKIVAVDMPSGICSDSGRALGANAQYIRADLTVAFHRAKVGHMLAHGPDACGALVIADIGL